jgi:hypothetical protein
MTVCHRAPLRTNDGGSPMIPNDPDTLLRRSQAAQALTECGFPVKVATLATMACRGGGPPYRLFGTRPLYRWGDAVLWAQNRLSEPRRNSSDADASARCE